MSPTCSECSRAVKARGFCSVHYSRWRTSREEWPTCMRDGCVAPQHARGMCRSHYTRWRKDSPECPRCTVEGCGRAASAKTLCSMHYQRLRAEGDPGETAPRRGDSREIVAGDQRHCPKCDTIQNRDGFYTQDWDRTTTRAWCKRCRWIRGMANAAGIPADAVFDFVRSQPQECQICGSAEKLVIDHCHETGALRGILCRNHNLLLGMAEDSPKLLRASASYLEKSQGSNLVRKA